MNPWYFQCCSVTAWKVLRWFCDSPGIMHLWLVWWVWCSHGNAAERLWRLEGVNILKGRVRAECMERSHVAMENTGEHRRMLRMKFYITIDCLECHWWVTHSKKHHCWFKKSSVRFEDHFPFVPISDPNIIVSPSNIQFSESSCSFEFVQEFADQW